MAEALTIAEILRLTQEVSGCRSLSEMAEYADSLDSAILRQKMASFEERPDGTFVFRRSVMRPNNDG